MPGCVPLASVDTHPYRVRASGCSRSPRWPHPPLGQLAAIADAHQTEGIVVHRRESLSRCGPAVRQDGAAEGITPQLRQLDIELLLEVAVRRRGSAISPSTTNRRSPSS